MAETTMEARPIPTEEPGKEKKKRKFSFPSAFTILFIVTIIAVICTWFVPAGQYSKLLYDADSGKLEMTTPTGETSQLDATQQTLDDLGVKIDIDQFTSGAITKAVSIPGTYEGLDPHPVSLADIPYSMVWGVIDGIEKGVRTWFFVLAFTAIGLSTNFRELAPYFKGGKPLILYVCGQSFNLALTLLMAYVMFYLVFPEITAKI